jgi:hypothetical protein
LARGRALARPLPAHGTTQTEQAHKLTLFASSRIRVRCPSFRGAEDSSCLRLPHQTISGAHPASHPVGRSRPPNYLWGSPSLPSSGPFSATKLSLGLSQPPIQWAHPGHQLSLGLTQPPIQWALLGHQTISGAHPASYPVDSSRPPNDLWGSPSLLSSGHQTISGAHPASYPVATKLSLGLTQPPIRWTLLGHQTISGVHPAFYPVATKLSLGLTQPPIKWPSNYL